MFASGLQRIVVRTVIVAWLSLLFAPMIGSAQEAASESAESEIHAGETVIVAIEKAEFGLKDKVNATLVAGDRIRVTEVRGSWVGGFAIVDGKRMVGWLNRSEVKPLRIAQGEVQTIVVPDQDDDPAAVEALTKLGVNLEKNEKGRVQSLAAGEAAIDDAALAHLQGLSNLATIELSGQPITDDGLKHLAELPCVQKLYLDGTKITDAGLAHLKGLKHVEVLAVNETAVTGSGLSQLGAMTQLRVLNLSDCPATDAALALLQRFPKLEVLALPNTKVSSAGLAHLSWIEGLRVLNVSGTKVTDDGLDNLEGLEELRMLYVRETEVSEERVEKLREMMPSLAIYQ